MFNKNESLKNLISFVEDLKEYLSDTTIQGVDESDYIETNIIRCFALGDHFFFDTRIKDENKYLDCSLTNALGKAKKLKLLSDEEIEVFKKNNPNLNYNKKLLSFLLEKTEVEGYIDKYLEKYIFTQFKENIFHKDLKNGKRYYANYIKGYESLLVDNDGVFFRKSTRGWFSPGYKINVKPLYEKILKLIEPYVLDIKSNNIDDLQEKIKVEIGKSNNKVYISFLHDLLTSNFDFEKFYDNTVLYFYERLDKSIAKDVNDFRKNYLVFVLADLLKKENLP